MAPAAAAAQVTRLMDFGSGRCTSAISRAYEHLFFTRWDEAVEAIAAAGDSPYARAVRAQIEMLVLGRTEELHRASATGPAMTAFHLSEALHVNGQLEQAATLIRRAMASSAAPAAPANTWLRLALCRCLLFQGRPRAALDVLSSIQPRSPISTRSVRCLQAIITGIGGDLRATETALDRIRAEIEHPATYADAGICLMVGLGLAMAGLPERADEMIQYGGGGSQLPRLPMSLRAYAFDVLIEASLLRGEPARAIEHMRSFDRLDLQGNAQFLAARETARARLEVAWPRASRAATVAQAHGVTLVAVRAAAAAGRPLAQAGELADWLRSAPPAGDRDLADLTARQTLVARLVRAGLTNKEIATHLGTSARSVEAHITTVKRRWGVARRVSMVRSAGGREVELTLRQREVASALAGGLTNQEIANRLGISIKTVEKHLTGIYAALGVTNRAAAVSRLGVLPIRAP